MTAERLNELRTIANAHKGHQSAEYMNELIAYTDELRNLYALALTFGWSDQRSKAVAFSKLKELAIK